MKRSLALSTVLLALLVLALPCAAAAGTYTYQFSFGSVGTGNGQFGDTVSGMDYNPVNERLYLADYRNGRIVVYDKDGAFVQNMGTYGTGTGEFTYPRDVEFNNVVWVTDEGAPKVLAIGGSEVLLDSNPTGLVIAGDHSIWVCTSRGLRNYASGSQEPLSTIPGAYADIATDGVNLYVTDYSGSRILKYDSTGAFAGVVASTGTAPGQVRNPWGIKYTMDGLIVGDDGNGRVQIINPNGEYGTVLPDPPDLGGFDNPDAVAAGGGRIYVCDDNVIRCYSTGGTTLETLSLTRSPSGSSYTLRRRNGVATFTYRVTAKTAQGQTVAGKVVKLQKSANGTRWTTKYTLTTGSQGTASKKLRFTTRGTSYWRWYSAADGTFKAAAAKKTKLVVR